MPKMWIEPNSDLDRYPEYDQFSGEEFSTQLVTLALSYGRPLTLTLASARDISRGGLPTEATVGDLLLSHPIDY